MDAKMDFLTRLAHAIAVQFGSNCEVVIHDLNDKALESSIVAIENGHVSNRNVGDGPSMVVLDTLMKNGQDVCDQLNYMTEVDGKIIKSSTIFIRDDAGKVKGIFGINFDISPMVMFRRGIEGFTKTGSEQAKEESTHIYHDVNSLLDDLIKRAVKAVGKPVAYMTREDKIKAIQFLNEHGAFLITKAGDKISNYFGISKYTMYSYIDKDKIE